MSRIKTLSSLVGWIIVAAIDSSEQSERRRSSLRPQLELDAEQQRRLGRRPLRGRDRLGLLLGGPEMDVNFVWLEKGGVRKHAQRRRASAMGCAVALILALGAGLLPDSAPADMLCQHRKSKRVVLREECTGKYRRVLDLASRPPVISAQVDTDPEKAPVISDESWFDGGTFFAGPERVTAELRIKQGIFVKAPRCVVTMSDTDGTASGSSVEVTETDATTIQLELHGTSAGRLTFICVESAPSEEPPEAAAEAAGNGEPGAPR